VDKKVIGLKVLGLVGNGELNNCSSSSTGHVGSFMACLRDDPTCLPNRQCIASSWVATVLLFCSAVPSALATCVMIISLPCCGSRFVPWVCPLFHLSDARRAGPQPTTTAVNPWSWALLTSLVTPEASS
jgi:hypothetical protein